MCAACTRAALACMKLSWSVLCSSRECKAGQSRHFLIELMRTASGLLAQPPLLECAGTCAGRLLVLLVLVLVSLLLPLLSQVVEGWGAWGVLASAATSVRTLVLLVLLRWWC